MILFAPEKNLCGTIMLWIGSLDDTYLSVYWKKKFHNYFLR